MKIVEKEIVIKIYGYEKWTLLKLKMFKPK